MRSDCLMRVINPQPSPGWADFEEHTGSMCELWSFAPALVANPPRADWQQSWVRERFTREDSEGALSRQLYKVIWSVNRLSVSLGSALVYRRGRGEITALSCHTKLTRRAHTSPLLTSSSPRAAESELKGRECVPPPVSTFFLSCFYARKGGKNRENSCFPLAVPRVFLFNSK